MTMVQRALIVAQIVCVALLGVATRGAPLTPVAQGWPEISVALGFYPVLLGFPAAIAFASQRAGLTQWKRWVVLGVEVALGFATLLAILPAVQ